MLPLPADVIVLYDMDGVLVESEHLHFEKLTVTAALHGVLIDKSAFASPQSFQVPNASGQMVDVTMSLHGAGDKNIYYWALARKPELRNELTMTQWLDELLMYYYKHADRITARERIADVIRTFHVEGAIQGVVTSGIRRQVLANLRCIEDVAEHFRCVLTADHVKQSKPHPEGYLLGLERARQALEGRQAKGAVGIEDSPAGVQAVLAAGMSCVQYVLPGQAPVQVAEADRYRFRVAHTSAEVEACVRELACVDVPALHA